MASNLFPPRAMAYPKLHADSGADTPDLERDIAHVLRTLPVDEREAWRRKDALRGRIRVAYHLDALLRGAHRARQPLDELLRLPSAIEGFIYDLYGNTGATLHWVAASRFEQEVNRETDLAQHDALESRGDRTAFPAAARRAAAAFARQRMVSGLCERAVRQALRTGQVA